MRAIVITRPGGPEVLQLRDVEDPQLNADEVLIAIEAFGLNHAELYFRSGKWGDPAVVPITGIECAGTVEVDRSGRFAPGTKVVSIMGGMGRTRNGAYAERVTVPAANVVPVETTLPWTDLVAIPETYATAWMALHDNLALQPSQTIVVRGATSALGRAAVNLAVDHGATVVATTRNPRRASQLEALGASRVLVDDGKLAGQVHAAGIEVDALFDLIGKAALRDSLATVRSRGRVCNSGFLGGLGPIDGFDTLVDLPTGVQFSFFGSFVLGTDDFPISAVPIRDIVAKAEAGVFEAKPARVFGFTEVAEAHRAMEANEANGKLVVSVRDDVRP